MYKQDAPATINFLLLKKGFLSFDYLLILTTTNYWQWLEHLFKPHKNN